MRKKGQQKKNHIHCSFYIALEFYATFIAEQNVFQES